MISLGYVNGGMGRDPFRVELLKLIKSQLPCRILTFDIPAAWMPVRQWLEWKQDPAGYKAAFGEIRGGRA